MTSIALMSTTEFDPPFRVKTNSPHSIDGYKEIVSIGQAAKYMVEEVGHVPLLWQVTAASLEHAAANPAQLSSADRWFTELLLSTDRLAPEEEELD